MRWCPTREAVGLDLDVVSLCSRLVHVTSLENYRVRDRSTSTYAVRTECAVRLSDSPKRRLLSTQSSSLRFEREEAMSGEHSLLLDALLHSSGSQFW